MYQIEAWSALRKARHDRRRDQSWFSVSRNVWALGVTSLFTDIASEMVGTVLPIYLVLHLGLTPFHYGIVDGLYHGVTALLRLFSGVVVDRSGEDFLFDAGWIAFGRFPAAFEIDGKKLLMFFDNCHCKSP